MIGGTAGARVWVDGELVPADARHLSAFDRGFQLGDGVFETLRARSGRPVEIEEHLARLRSSAAGLAISLRDDVESAIRAAIDDVLGANELGALGSDAGIRITVSRGAIMARGLLPPRDARGGATPPTLVVQAWPIEPPLPALLEHGLQLIVSSVRQDPESPLSALKTTSRADYVYARLEADRAGADDALFLTIDGHLSEATSANLFLVRAAELSTPALACAILPGTTRSWILRWAESEGLTTVETWLTTRDLAEADESFLSSSVAGILPVTRLDGHAIGSGRPGPWTKRAGEAREAFIRALDAPERRRRALIPTAAE